MHICKLTTAKFPAAAFVSSVGLALLAVAADRPVVEEKISSDQLAFFERKIRPVLAAKCYKCHSAESEKAKGGLLLDTRDGIRSGGATGHAVVPGSLKDSLLIAAIRGEKKDMEMPPKEKLPADVIADFERWILMGAPDPRDGKLKVAAKNPASAESRAFWSFQPVKNVQPPKVKDGRWPVTDVDRFILAALEAKGIKPVADADRLTLLRRVCFDLVGLPPTPTQVSSFLADKSPKAFEKIVDELLASPQFGERWGRHWLDVARYAESSGKERNYGYPEAWRYRDYVIASFNADKPYDRFIREQVAGDLLPAKNGAERNELIIASGFLAIGPKGLNERNREAFIMEQVDEQIDVTTRAVLALTVSCARCHDHKFDPISTKDYYAVAGIYKSTATFYGTDDRGGKNRQASTLIPLSKPDAAVAAHKMADAAAGAATAPKRSLEQTEAKLKEFADRNPKLAARLRGMTPREKVELLERLESKGTAKPGKATKNQKPADAPVASVIEPSGEKAMGVLDGKPADCPIYVRGELEEKGPVIPRGFVTVLGPVSAPKVNASQSGRLELAQWLTAADNPLTARVMANRVWQHLFGKGLVTTPDNFGATGERPSHPELLDYLAQQFVAGQWSVKKLVRSIVLSRTYRLAGANDAKAFAADPDNTLLWRANQRRLDAESIRDAVLAASGRLDLAPMRGSVVAEIGDGQIGGKGGKGGALRTDSLKRSVYLPIVRDMVPDVLELFDFAEPSLVIASRDVTNVPSQALFMLNSAFIYDQSSALAQLLAKEGDTASRVTTAYVRALSRTPTTAEQQRAEQFITRLSAEPGCTPDTAWTTFCQALLASAEFRYIK